MRRSSALVALAAGASTLLVAPAPAGAVAGSPVHVVAHTTGDVSDFESSLAGCETGTVVNGPNHVVFTGNGGLFNGDKEFTCAGGEAGFTVRLKARFSNEGSTGTWVVTDACGGFAGLKGSGSLVGIIVDGGIDDVYTGSVR